MKENEKEVIDETIENTEGETQKDVNEVEETNDDELSNDDESSNDDELSNDEPSLEDYRALEKKVETLEAQKEHWRKKAAQIKEQPLKETNKNYLTRDEGILLAKGYDEDDIEKLNKLAGNGSLIEATKDPLFVAYKKAKEQKEKSEKAKLGSSNSFISKGQKSVGEMTEKEHRELFYRSIR